MATLIIRWSILRFNLRKKYIMAYGFDNYRRPQWEAKLIDRSLQQEYLIMLIRSVSWRSLVMMSYDVIHVKHVNIQQISAVISGIICQQLELTRLGRQHEIMKGSKKQRWKCVRRRIFRKRLLWYERKASNWLSTVRSTTYLYLYRYPLFRTPLVASSSSSQSLLTSPSRAAFCLIKTSIHLTRACSCRSSFEASNDATLVSFITVCSPKEICSR